MKKILFVLLFMTAALAFASEGFTGNKVKGKYSLRKIYKQCMARGEVQSETPPISPADRTQAYWSDIYSSLKAGAIGDKMKDFGCQKEWVEADAETLSDVFTYMYMHASDSPTPAKCK